MSVNIVVVGDSKSGKTSLISALQGQPSPILADSTTVADATSFDATVGNVTSTVNLFDTTSRIGGGRVDMGRSRRIALMKADVVLITVNVATFDRAKANANTTTKVWMPEAQRVRPGVPVIVVGTQIDMREDPSSRAMLKTGGHATPLSTEEGEEFAANLGAKFYHEISAVSKEGVEDLLELAVTQARIFKATPKVTA